MGGRMVLFNLQELTQTGLLPHGICLSWKPSLLLLHVLSDGLIAASYFSIPFGIAHFVSQRKDLEYRWMFILFAGFILACGTTHLMDIWTLWHPDYQVQGIIKAITACISVASAILLWPVIGKALRLPSPKQLARINAELQREIRSRQATVAELEQEAMERRRLEAQLRQNQARLQAVLDTTVEGILSIDSNGQIQLANRASCQMFGIEISEKSNISIHDLMAGEFPTTPPFTKAASGPSNEGGGNVVSLQGRHRNGTSFPIEASIGAHGEDPNDEPLFTYVVRDMTEKHRTEQLVREKETRLKQQEHQLLMIQRQNTAGELTAMVSHEINQPLGAITNYLGGISLRYEDVLNQNPGLKETLNETLRLAKRTSDIIQGIRNLVRRRPGDLVPVDVRELVEETLLLLNAEFNRRHIELRTRFDPALPKPLGDRIQLQQLLLNLILNAIDALDTETSPTQRKQLLVELRESAGDHLSIIIIDNGKGLKPTEAERIFEPFYSTKDSGVGLGLSICKSIVEAHGGFIFATPDPLGTKFVVELPSQEQKGE